MPPHSPALDGGVGPVGGLLVPEARDGMAKSVPSHPAHSNRRYAMPKIAWNDFLERCPRAHVVIAAMPDASDEDRLSGGLATQRLLERLLKKLAFNGGCSVAVLRQNGQREIVC